MYSMLTINTPEWRHWHCSGVFIVDFEDASPFFIVFIDDLERVNDCWGCHLSWQLILIYRDSFLTGMTRSDTAAYLYFLVHVLSSQTCQLIGEENFLSRPKFWQRTPECVKASIFFRCQLMFARCIFLCDLSEAWEFFLFKWYRITYFSWKTFNNSRQWCSCICHGKVCTDSGQW